MAFDLERFKATAFSPREEVVALPALSALFGEGEAPAFRVRGLTGQELGRVAEAARRNQAMAAAVEAMLGADDQARIEALRKLLGVGDDLTEETARRLEMLLVGCVEPQLDMAGAVMLCTAFPIEFRELTDSIIRLTGAGHVPGEPKGSGVETTSGPASPGATSTTSPSTL